MPSQAVGAIVWGGGLGFADGRGPGSREGWAYLAGPVAGGVIAVGFVFVLRGRGGGRNGVAAAQGTLGVDWRPGSHPRT